jgi:hypothetical protein
MDATLFRQVLLNMVRNGVEANLGRKVAFGIEVTATAEKDHRRARRGDLLRRAVRSAALHHLTAADCVGQGA